MRSALILSIIVFFTLISGSCESEESKCNELLGTYTGTLSGMFNGQITLVVTEYKIDGVWTATDNSSGTTYGGVAIDLNFNCANGGAVEYVYGFGLKSPMSVLCPNGVSWCYDSGATLGLFKGTLNANSGAGIYKADTGAAETIGMTGTGTWSVTKN